MDLFDEVRMAKLWLNVNTSLRRDFRPEAGHSQIAAATGLGPDGDLITSARAVGSEGNIDGLSGIATLTVSIKDRRIEGVVGSDHGLMEGEYPAVQRL